MSVVEQHKSVYAYMGQRIRDRRKQLKLNQTQLAEMMGFSYQQMQKYENGSSQISVGKLLRFAKILNVAPGYFYEGVKLEGDAGKETSSGLIQNVRTEPLQILLVEDSPADVLLFKKALELCDGKAESQVMHDAEMAMDFLQHHDRKYARSMPDLIVLDLTLPKTNGLQVLKSLKKHAKTREVPVVVLTHSVNAEEMVEAYRSGAAGFIQKSMELQEYMESINITLQYWSRVVALPA